MQTLYLMLGMMQVGGAASRGKPNVLFIHVGKAGGGTIRDTIKSYNLTHDITIKHPWFRLNNESWKDFSHVIINIRDPVSRYVSLVNYQMDIVKRISKCCKSRGLVAGQQNLTRNLNGSNLVVTPQENVRASQWNVCHGRFSSPTFTAGRLRELLKRCTRRGARAKIVPTSFFLNATMPCRWQIMLVG
jgi:hypothetical protein